MARATKYTIDPSCGWTHALVTDKLQFLCPEWGPALRGVTDEELQLYREGLALPMRPGQVQGDYLESNYW